MLPGGGSPRLTRWSHSETGNPHPGDLRTERERSGAIASSQYLVSIQLGTGGSHHGMGGGGVVYTGNFDGRQEYLHFVTLLMLYMYEIFCFISSQ